MECLWPPYTSLPEASTFPAWRRGLLKTLLRYKHVPWDRGWSNPCFITKYYNRLVFLISLDLGVGKVGRGLMVNRLLEGRRAGDLSHMVGTCLGDDKFSRCLSGGLWIAESHWAPVEKGGKGHELGHSGGKFTLMWPPFLDEPSMLAVSKEHSIDLTVVLPTKGPFGICYFFSWLLTFVLFVWYCSYNFIHCHFPSTVPTDDRYYFI